jgi:hypothetical protein
MPNVRIDAGTPGLTARSEVQSSPAGMFDGPGENDEALTPSEARALSVPGTPHFGAQTDMLKTLDESTKVIKQSHTNKMSGAQTPSVSGIGTLLDKPDYSEAKIVVAMVCPPSSNNKIPRST